MFAGEEKGRKYGRDSIREHGTQLSVARRELCAAMARRRVV